MSPVEIGFVCLGILCLLLFMGVPVGITMGVVGFVGMVWVSGLNAGLGILKTVPLATVSNYDYSVIPLFLLMGGLCFYSGLSESLFRTTNKWLGRLPGGLAMATVGGCAIFASVSGSAVATTATICTAALPEMKKYKYDSGLATACIAAGGTIGVLIPPSVPLMIYGILTQQSIGKLFLAGFIPGVLQAIFYIVTIYILCKRNPLLGPRGPKTSFREKVSSLKDIWKVLFLFIFVIGGIYLGVFTPIEAAGIGAFFAFIIFALAAKGLRQKFTEVLLETCKTTAMVVLIIIGAAIFNYFLAVTRLPAEIANIVANLHVSRHIVLAVIVIVYLMIGTVMDELAMILLTIPIFFPVVESLGFNPIWFGIIIIKVFELGAISPPVGMTIYVTYGMAKDVPLTVIFRGVVPFIISDICHTFLLIVFPQVALFLPDLMK